MDARSPGPGRTGTSSAKRSSTPDRLVGIVRRLLPFVLALAAAACSPATATLQTTGGQAVVADPGAGRGGRRAPRRARPPPPRPPRPPGATPGAGARAGAQGCGAPAGRGRPRPAGPRAGGRGPGAGPPGGGRQAPKAGGITGALGRRL